MNPNTQNEDIIALRKKFDHIDTASKGYITSDQLLNYFKTQPTKPSMMYVNQLFSVTGQQVTQSQFVAFMLGVKIHMEPLAIARLHFQKQLGKFADPSPPGGGVNQIRESYVKFKVLAKDHEQGNIQDKKHFRVKFGCDKESQNEKAAKIYELLGRDCPDVFLMIKFKMEKDHDKMASLSEQIFGNLKGLLMEMAPDLTDIIESINISCKTDGTYVYYILQVNDTFFTEFAAFLSEMTAILNPEAQFVFSLLIESAFLKNVLKEGGQKKMDDLEVQFNLKVDSQSLNKMKEIYTSLIGEQKIKYYDEHERTIGLFVTLLNEVKFEANFTQSQKVFEEAGLGDGLAEGKERLNFLKEMNISETASGFVPEFEEFKELLKEGGKGEGQISVNLKNCFAMVDFSVGLKGFLDYI